MFLVIPGAQKVHIFDSMIEWWNTQHFLLNEQVWLRITLIASEEHLSWTHIFPLMRCIYAFLRLQEAILRLLCPLAATLKTQLNMSSLIQQYTRQNIFKISFLYFSWKVELSIGELEYKSKKLMQMKGIYHSPQIFTLRLFKKLMDAPHFVNLHQSKIRCTTAGEKEK